VPNLAMPATKTDGARGAARFGGVVATHKRAASGSTAEVVSSVPNTVAETVDLRASRRRSMML
jgi:hypothetical protein